MFTAFIRHPNADRFSASWDPVTRDSSPGSPLGALPHTSVIGSHSAFHVCPPHIF